MSATHGLVTGPVEEVVKGLNQRDDDELRAVAPDGSTLLFYAVQRELDADALLLAQYLVETRRACEATHLDANAQSALFFAARDGNLETCAFLLSCGCSPTQQDTAGQTALFYACREGHVDVIRLLEEWANQNNESIINIADKNAQTALFYAAREGHREACELLIELGADPNVKDWQKKAAHTYASRKGHSHVAAFLKSRMTSSLPSRSGAGESPQAKLAHAASAVDREKVMLQCCLKTAEAYEWVFPTPEQLQSFEQEFPSLSAWSHISPQLYQPLDGFRMEWGKACLEVLSIVLSYKEANWFSKPVDTRLLNCPDYYDVIREPMDLGTVKKNLKELKYERIGQFRRDVELVWSNCFTYNSDTSAVAKAAHKLAQAFAAEWQAKGLDQYSQREANLFNLIQLGS